MFDFTHAADHLAEYGLETVLWVPQEGTGADKIQLGGGKARALVRVADLVKFRQTFPNADAVVTAALDGQGFRVPDQAVIRAKVKKDRQVSDHDLVVAQLQRWAGIKATPTASPESVIAQTDDATLIRALAARWGVSEDEARERYEALSA